MLLRNDSKRLLLFAKKAWSWKRGLSVSERPITGIRTLLPFNGHTASDL